VEQNRIVPIPVETEVLVAEDGRERRSMLGVVSTHDSTGQVRLSLIEANKSATIHEPLIGLAGDSERKIKWLEQLKSCGKKTDKQLGTLTTITVVLVRRLAMSERLLSGTEILKGSFAPSSATFRVSSISEAELPVRKFECSKLFFESAPRRTV